MLLNTNVTRFDFSSFEIYRGVLFTKAAIGEWKELKKTEKITNQFAKQKDWAQIHNDTLFDWVSEMKSNQHYLFLISYTELFLVRLALVKITA